MTDMFSPCAGINQSALAYNNCAAKNNCSVKAVKNSLERIPKNDTVSFSGDGRNNIISKDITFRDIKFLKDNTEYSRPTFWNGDYNIEYGNPDYPENNYSLNVDNKLFFTKVTGKICDWNVDLKVKYRPLNAMRGTIKGTIDNMPVNMEYNGTDDGKGFELNGILPYEEVTPVLALLAYDKAYT